MSRTPTLTAEARARLEALGAPAVDGPKPGWCTLTGGSYTTSSTASSGNSKGDKPVTVPSYIESLETLEYFGFEESTANRIWDRYIKYHDETLEFMDFVTGHLQGCQDAIAKDDDWNKAMEEMGIGKRLREAILDPDFDEIRLTGSARTWVLDTIQNSRSYLKMMSPCITGRVDVDTRYWPRPDLHP
ncbi:hypothetical protein L228DRAFT_243619 [Xylona heveae TC161]|uniref:Uncharacterized protein n=1 Tax=Xylona heveae (strain CBS 132557 / TC161) TaxID=1328760 RepID=A0A165IGY0_XYLHT|nr:hypothetical protein L228DRAFT_243619 [Xylona heveae TC161]KZF24880.1 hypothetical protein L228DRAFT_243619 [Xylona heveae TC161]